MDLRDELLSFDATNNIPEPPFTFPRGGIKPHEKGIDAALREFAEETGIRCTVADLSPVPIDHYEEGLVGREYHMQCWKANLTKEFSLDDRKNSEIKRREWVKIP